MDIFDIELDDGFFGSIYKLIIDTMLNGNVDKLQSLLVNERTIIKQYTYDSNKLLHIAFEHGSSSQIIKILTDFDEKSMFKINKHGYTPLHIALLYPKENMYEATILLIKNMMMYDILSFGDLKIKREPITDFLKKFLHCDDLLIIKQYANSYLSCVKSIGYLIVNAMKNDNIDELKSFLKDSSTKMEIEKFIFGKNTIIHTAFQCCCSERIINFLIDIDIVSIFNIDEYGNTPLYYALSYEENSEQTIISLIETMIRCSVGDFKNIKIKGRKIMDFLKWYLPRDEYKKIKENIEEEEMYSDIRKSLYNFDYDRCVYCNQGVCYCKRGNSSFDDDF